MSYQHAAKEAGCIHDKIPWKTYVILEGFDWQWRQCPSCHLVQRRVIGKVSKP